MMALLLHWVSWLALSAGLLTGLYLISMLLSRLLGRECFTWKGISTLLPKTINIIALGKVTIARAIVFGMCCFAAGFFLGGYGNSVSASSLEDKKVKAFNEWQQKWEAWKIKHPEVNK